MGEADYVTRVDLGTLINGLGLDASPQATVDVERFERVKLQVQLTRGGLATNVQVTVEETEDDVTFSKATFIDASGTVTPMVFTRTTSVSENFSAVIENLSSIKKIRLTFDGASATAADTVIVTGVKSIDN